MSKSKQECVVEHMIKLRDARAALKESYEKEDRALRERFAKGEAWLLNELETAGASGMKFDCGTVSCTTTMHASIGDWTAFATFVIEQNEVDLLQHRVSTTNLKEYLKQTGDEVPPGINITNIRGISIRRNNQ